MEHDPGVPSIACDRFELAPLTLDVIEALLTGDLASAERRLDVTFPQDDWLPGAAHMLRFRRDDLTRDPSVQPWIARAIVLPDRRMAGYAGFHGPPDTHGVCELGYTVFEAFRRRGIASQAALCLMRWARDEHGIRRFRVSISPDNAPSLAMAEKLGFARTGERIDEIDGLEWIFELAIT
jgi:RimJ/RimL family protein N-acetyltransferase